MGGIISLFAFIICCTCNIYDKYLLPLIVGTAATVNFFQAPFADIALLLTVIERLKGKGNSIVIIEHNLDVIKTADYIIDLGPEGGDGGGRIIASGTPEVVAQTKGSYTGKYLADVLANSQTEAAAE